MEVGVGSGGWAIMLGTVLVDTRLELVALVDMALSLALDLFTRYDRGGGGASGKSSSERSIGCISRPRSVSALVPLPVTIFQIFANPFFFFGRSVPTGEHFPSGPVDWERRGH